MKNPPATLQIAAATLCGGLSTVGWAPAHLWPVALAAYAALLALLLSTNSAVRAAAIGFAFGAGLHLTGHEWVVAALHERAGVSSLFAASAAMFFAALLATFIALACAAFTACRRSIVIDSGSAAISVAAAFASLCGAGDYARSWFFNGFASLSLGYALVDTWLAALAAVGGVWLVSWAGLFGAGLCVLAWVGNASVRIASAASIAFGLLGCNWLAALDWTQPQGATLNFRLLQVNLTQREKFAPDRVARNVEHVLAVVEQGTADLVVTPETALPLFFDSLPEDKWARLRSAARTTGSHLLLGIGVHAEGRSYNAVLHVAPAERLGIEDYRKVRLMPFGEYTPRGFAWFSEHLALPMKDLDPGPADQPPFTVREQRLGLLVCQEDMVPDDARSWAMRGATILVNPSNLAWFQGSAAIEQRMQVARMRAIETGRPLLRVANTGVTAQIDEHGRVRQRLEPDTEGVLAGTVQGSAGSTPFVRFGDLTFLALVVLTVALCIDRRLRTE